MTLPPTIAVALAELILAGGAMLLLIWGAYARRTGAIFNTAAVAVLIAAAVAAANGPLGRVFAGGLVADGMAVFAKVTIYLASAVAIPLGDRWFRQRGVARFEFPVLVLLAALGMGMMASAGDLISLYVG